MLSQRIRKQYYKTLGTSVTNSTLSTSSQTVVITCNCDFYINRCNKCAELNAHHYEAMNGVCVCVCISEHTYQ